MKQTVRQSIHAVVSNPSVAHYFKSPKGQALVVLLLILVVTLTIGLSVVARTTVNIKESSTTERSSRAFSAAEAHIESTLRQDIPSLLGGAQATTLPSITIGGATSTVTISKTGDTSSAYQPIKQIVKDDVIQLDVDASHLSGGSPYADHVFVDWSLVGTSEQPACTPPTSMAAALEISVVYWDGGNSATSYDIRRYAYSANGCADPSNGFDTSASVDPTGKFVSEKLIDLSPIGALTARIIRLRPLYTAATVRVIPARGGTKNTGALPVQSYKIRSEGVAGETKRVVEVERSIGGLPAILDYVLFNGNPATPLQKN